MRFTTLFEPTRQLLQLHRMSMWIQTVWKIWIGKHNRQFWSVWLITLILNEHLVRLYIYYSETCFPLFHALMFTLISCTFHMYLCVFRENVIETILKIFSCKFTNYRLLFFLLNEWSSKKLCFPKSWIRITFFIRTLKSSKIRYQLREAANKLLNVILLTQLSAHAVYICRV